MTLGVVVVGIVSDVVNVVRGGLTTTIAIAVVVMVAGVVVGIVSGGLWT